MSDKTVDCMIIHRNSDKEIEYFHKELQLLKFKFRF